MGGIVGSWQRILDRRASDATGWETARWHRTKPPSASFSDYDPAWGQLPKRWCPLHLAPDRCWKKREAPHA